MLWIIYALLSCIFWGVCFTLLIPVSEQLNPYIINFIYGCFLCCVNLIIIAITNTFDEFKLLSNVKLTLYLIFYVITLTSASISFLFGYSVNDINPAIYIIISNTYPIITFILSYFIFNKTNVNLYYASFGIILTLIGGMLLAFSKK